MPGAPTRGACLFDARCAPYHSRVGTALRCYGWGPPVACGGLNAGVAFRPPKERGLEWPPNGLGHGAPPAASAPLGSRARAQGDVTPAPPCPAPSESGTSSSSGSTRQPLRARGAGAVRAMTSQGRCLMKKLVLGETPALRAQLLRVAPSSIAEAYSRQAAAPSLVAPGTLPVEAPNDLPQPRHSQRLRPRPSRSVADDPAAAAPRALGGPVVAGLGGARRHLAADCLLEGRQQPPAVLVSQPRHHVPHPSVGHRPPPLRRRHRAGTNASGGARHY